MEFTLLGAVVFAYVAFWVTMWWEGPRGNAAGCARSPFDTAVAATMAGLLAGRLASMIGGGVNPLTNPADILIVRSGVATGPAALTGLLVYGWLSRSELIAMFDAVAPAAVAGLAGWHAGCLVRGTCLGTQSDLPWAMTQPGSTITRHPVEIYAAVLMGVVAGVLAWWKYRGRPAVGLPAGIALAAASAVRLVTEPLRTALGTGPVWWYVAGVACGLAVAVVAHRRRVTRAFASGDG